MICQSCQKNEIPADATACPECGWNFDKNQQPASLIGPLARPKADKTATLAITIDRTASSERFKMGCELIIKGLFEDLKKNNISPSIFLFSHGDKDSGQEVIMHTDNGTIESTVADYQAINFGGGGHPKESHLDAIGHIKNSVPWQSKSNNMIIGIMNDESKPLISGSPPDLLGNELLQDDISLILICEVTPLLYKLAKSAGGYMIPLSNSPNLEELQIISQQLSASVADIMHSDTEPLFENKH